MTSAENEKVDALLQFALLAAGEADDFRERMLGPIHLIKYVYLAEVAYAGKHDGQSFTGTHWQFYHFGPWAPAVLERIEPALTSIGARRIALESDYGDRGEWVRWASDRRDLVRQYEQKLPAVMVLNIRTMVRRFGADTANLLDFVYRTEPMRNAAPMEFLDFSLVTRRATTRSERSTSDETSHVSAKKLKVMRQKILDSRKQRASASARQVLVNPSPGARFDAIYAEGVAWLDSLAGESVAEGEKRLEFAADVWKSPARTEHEPS